MVDETNLINRLKKQAQLYEEIDAGTGYGYDKDAENIREAIHVITTFMGAWEKLKAGIKIR